MPEARKAKLAELDGDLAEAESLIRRMDLEARTQPPEAEGELAEGGGRGKYMEGPSQRWLQMQMRRRRRN